MAIRRYQRPSFCKHAKHPLNVMVVVKESCPAEPKLSRHKDMIDKKTCRECENFELKKSEGE